MSFVNVALALELVWLLAVTIGLIYIFPFFYKLTKSGKEEDIKQILSRLLKEALTNRNELKAVVAKLGDLEKEDLNHIQKLGLVRFNPFSETGGDHSFCLAILDGKDSGVVITGLHTRERTRIYIKPILRGKSELTLSLEEKKAIEKALKV